MASIRVTVIGDVTPLSAALKTASGEVQTFGAKAEASFAGVAKSALLMGGAFLGASGVVDAFTKSIKAGEDLNVATKQLDAQLRANGESVKAISPYIDTLNSSMQQLGFTNTQTEEAFTRLDRASGSAALAYKSMSVAADLARAKHIDLSQAALLVGKVIDGNVSALNRYGIAIPKGTSVIDALALAHQKLAGQAAAAVTPMQQFSATVTDLEAKIGQALLPTIDKYLTEATKWLSSAQNQKKITDDVKEAVALFTTGMNDLVSAVKAIAGPTETAVSDLGGLKNVFEILIGLKFAMIASGWAGALGTTASNASKAESAAASLSGKLKALSLIGPIVIGIDLVATSSGRKTLLDHFNVVPHTSVPGLDWLAQEVGLQKKPGPNLGGVLPGNFPGLPSTALGGSTSDTGAFITDLIKYFGGNPNGASANVLATWQRMEGGSTNNTAAYNFLNTTLREPGSSSMNSVGVQAYQSFGQGLQATIQTLMHGYPAIVNAIATGNWAPSQELASELSKWSGGGYSAILASAGGGGGSGLPPGSTLPPATAAASKSKKTFKIPDALEASIRLAQDAFVHGVTQQHLDTLTSLLSQEESLLKQHHELAKAASVANEITDAQDKLTAAVQKQMSDQAKALVKVALSDEATASSDATKAAAAFSKGQTGPASAYIKDETKALTDAQEKLGKALTLASGKDKAADQKEFDKVTAELASLSGLSAWIQTIGKILKDMNDKLTAEAKQAGTLLSQKTGESELAAVGFFQETPQAILGTDQAIVGNLKDTLSTLTTNQAKLQAQLKANPLKAGLATIIAGIGAKITATTQAISQAMGTVEQDLASALQQAQSQLQSAVASLQSNLDSQLQTLANASSGYTADAATLAGMQTADTINGLNDTLTSATSQLAADQAAGASPDVLAADQKAIDAANRQITEYNLQTKTTQELATAQAAAATQQTKLNTQLAGFESDLLSGKITAAQFTDDLKGLQTEFGVTISDTVTPELVGVASAASNLESAFDALIAWVNKQTGSTIPAVGSSTSAPPLNVSPQLPVSGLTGHGPQLWGGGIMPMHAFGGAVVPGWPRSSDYVPAWLNGGEMILNASQQRNLFGLINGSGSLGSGRQPIVVNNHVTVNGFVGNERQLVDKIQEGLLRKQARGNNLGFTS